MGRSESITIIAAYNATTPHRILSATFICLPPRPVNPTFTILRTILRGRLEPRRCPDARIRVHQNDRHAPAALSPLPDHLFRRVVERAILPYCQDHGIGVLV